MLIFRNVRKKPKSNIPHLNVLDNPLNPAQNVAIQCVCGDCERNVLTKLYVSKYNRFRVLHVIVRQTYRLTYSKQADILYLQAIKQLHSGSFYQSRQNKFKSEKFKHFADPAETIILISRTRRNKQVTSSARKFPCIYLYSVIYCIFCTQKLETYGTKTLCVTLLYYPDRNAATNYQCWWIFNLFNYTEIRQVFTLSSPNIQSRPMKVDKLKKLNL